MHVYRMAYKLSVVQDQASGSWTWQIVDTNRPSWAKRSLWSFRSGGLATAAGLGELKLLSRKNLPQPKRLTVTPNTSPWGSMLQTLQRRLKGA
jgi:hypothetical protein